MAVCHTVYAMIKDNVVRNLAVGSYYNCTVVAHNTYGLDAIAIDCTQYPVEINDTYEGGKFYRMIQGVKTEITRIPTEEETVEAHTTALESHDSAIDDLWVAILEG